MMESQEGLCLVPTFSPPKIYPSLMSKSQKIQLLLQLNSHSRENKISLFPSTKQLVLHSEKDLKTACQTADKVPTHMKNNPPDMNLFDGAFPYKSSSLRPDEQGCSSKNQEKFSLPGDQEHSIIRPPEPTSKNVPTAQANRKLEQRKRSNFGLFMKLDEVTSKKPMTTSSGKKTAESSALAEESVERTGIRNDNAVQIFTNSAATNAFEKIMKASTSAVSSVSDKEVSKKTDLSKTSTAASSADGNNSREKEQQPKFTSSSLAIQPYSESGVYLTADDFAGIQNVCKNIGSSIQSLSIFKKKLLNCGKICQVSFLFKDLSSNHSPVTTRYCKPSSPCHLWYCSCDKVIRSSKLKKDSLLAALFCLKGLKEIFFLPLIRCIEPEVINEGREEIKSSYIFPFKCETTVQQRVDFLLDFLCDVEYRKIVYHSQVSLLPIFDLMKNRKESSANRNPMISNIFDPKLASYLLNSDIPDDQLELYSLLNSFQVNLLEVEHLGQRLGKLSLCISKLNQEGISLLSLYDILHSVLIRDGLCPLFYEIEMPVNCLLSFMEYYGISVISSSIKVMIEMLNKDIHETEKRIYQLSGFSFNISSPEQVSSVLFDRLKILESSSSSSSVPKDGPSTIAINRKQKHLSTSEEELKKILHLHPVVEEILKYRALTKLKTTYIDGLTPFLIGSTLSFSSFGMKYQFIHAYWNQTSVRTGRLSCCKPNLQNIPVNQKIGDHSYSVRNFFCARPG
jgi:hypothetical protein